jgi:hypothetical protein
MRGSPKGAYSATGDMAGGRQADGRSVAVRWDGALTGAALRKPRAAPRQWAPAASFLPGVAVPARVADDGWTPLLLALASPKAMGRGLCSVAPSLSKPPVRNGGEDGLAHANGTALGSRRLRLLGLCLHAKPYSFHPITV